MKYGLNAKGSGSARTQNVRPVGGAAGAYRAGALCLLADAAAFHQRAGVGCGAGDPLPPAS